LKWTDEGLRDRIAAFLRTCGFVQPRHAIVVNVRDGIVTLTGWVAQEIDVRVVAVLVYRLDGVGAVRNLLRWEPVRGSGAGAARPSVSAFPLEVQRLTVGVP
jgi:osmotically-inducible protein OsmY